MLINSSKILLIRGLGVTLLLLLLPILIIKEDFSNSWLRVFFVVFTIYCIGFLHYTVRKIKELESFEKENNLIASVNDEESYKENLKKFLLYNGKYGVIIFIAPILLNNELFSNSYYLMIFIITLVIFGVTTYIGYVDFKIYKIDPDLRGERMRLLYELKRNNKL